MHMHMHMYMHMHMHMYMYMQMHMHRAGLRVVGLSRFRRKKTALKSVRFLGQCRSSLVQLFR
jgi:hypothetical protein